MIFVQNFFKRITKFSQDYLTLLAWLSNKAIIFYPSQLSLSLYALTFDSLDRCDLLIHFFSSKLPVSLCRMECLIHYSNYSEGKEISRWLLAAFSLWFIYGPGLSFFALLCDLHLKIQNIYQYHFQYPFLMGSGHLFFWWPMHANNMIHCKYVTKTCLFKLFYSVWVSMRNIACSESEMCYIW